MVKKKHEDAEALSKAVEELFDEKRKRDAADDTFIEDDDDQLLSQLESTKEINNADEGTDEKPAADKAKEEKEKQEETSVEEIAKEIKKLKRQNAVTHVLLSAMIVLTLTWQLSEFSIIMTMKNSFRHPFRSFRDMLAGVVRGRVRPIADQLPEIPHADPSKDQDSHDNGTHHHHHHHHHPLPSLRVPDMLRDLGFIDKEE